MNDQEKLDVIYRAVTQAVPRLEQKCDKHAEDIARVCERVEGVRERLGNVERRSTGLGSIAGGLVAGLLMFLKAHVPWMQDVFGGSK